MRRISSYGSKIHPHHCWLIERMYNMLERNGCLDFEDPEIIEDIKCTLITCNPEEQNLRRHILLDKLEARELIRAVSHKLPPVSRHPKDTITVGTGVYRLHFRKALGTWLSQSIYRG